MVSGAPRLTTHHSLLTKRRPREHRLELRIVPSLPGGRGRLSRSGISNRVRWFAKKAGVKLCMHKLRKEFGCRVAKILGKSGAAVLHELMRHSSMQVTMDSYANVDDTLPDTIMRLM